MYCWTIVTAHCFSPGPVLSGFSEVSVLEQVSSPCEFKTQRMMSKQRESSRTY